MFNFIKRKRNFLVLSAGKAGSSWLASSINLHPDITCSGGVDHPVISLGYYYNENMIDQLVKGISHKDLNYGVWFMKDLLEITPENYREKYGHLNYFSGNLLKFYHPNIDFKHRDLAGMINYIYDELETIVRDKTSVYGNVHAFTAPGYVAARKSYQVKKSKIVNLIRNPITRLESAINNAKYAYRYNYFDYQRNVDQCIKNNFNEIELIKKKFKLSEFTLNDMIAYQVLEGGNLLKSWETDILSLNVEQVSFERLISDIDYYKKIFMYLTGIVPDRHYLDLIHSANHLNSGRSPIYTKAKNSFEVFEGWPAWLKERVKINAILYKRYGIDEFPDCF